MVTAVVITKCECNGFSVIHYLNYSCQLSLGFSWLGQVPRLSLFALTLTVVRDGSQGLCRMSLNLHLSGVCLGLRLGLWLWGETTLVLG